VAAVQGNKLTYGKHFHNSERKKLKYELSGSSSGVICGGEKGNDGDTRNADSAVGGADTISELPSSPKRSTNGSLELFGSSWAISGEGMPTEEISDETGKEIDDPGERSIPEGLGGECRIRDDCSEDPASDFCVIS